MDILAILMAVLSLANFLTEFARDRQLLKAGEATAIKNNLHDTNKKLEVVINARRAASRNLGDWVRDPFNRDE